MTDPYPTLVLVVEDDALVRMDIPDELAHRGLSVLEAGNADEAISLLGERLDIEVIFTDVDMPGSMDGLKLAETVRNRWPPVKIIVTSGYRKISQDSLPKNSRFFTKPYGADAIAAAVREMVS